ncbi:MAG: magnesium chelatase, partial [Phycisphaeraceae bacterium]
VGLFNVLEERDVQIRGYPVRLNLDVCLVFSANPEDYTNRGRIVTPLKDRIGSVIRTHYPRTTDEAMQITQANAWMQREGEPDEAVALPKVAVPDLMLRIVEEAVSQARSSPHINQASGVSVRTSIACVENLVSSAERRGLVTGESHVMPRICDLQYILSSTRGKIELMLADDGDATEDKLVTSLVGEAIKSVFDQVADVDEYEQIVEPFEQGLKLTVGDDVSAAEQVASMKHVQGLLPAAGKLAKKLKLDAKDEQALACVGEFLLEALYVHNRLSKHGGAGESSYSR